MPEQLLFRVEEAAQRLGVGRSTAYELISSGRLPTVSIGRCRRVTAEALASFVASLSERESPAA
jgi:excisionase family DNA binding protein